MTRIEKRFEQLRSERRKAFIPYITAGDPSLDITLELVLALDKAGADLIELGVPFSDPIADGPTISESYTRALQHKVKLAEIFAMIAKVRPTVALPKSVYFS